MSLSSRSFDDYPLTSALIGDLRSDHAGECGAVEIYRGICAVSRNPRIHRFAREHLRTELRHRRFFDRWLPQQHQSRLLPVWRAAGWLLGASAALFGERSVYRTIAAVETFVERHYKEQIEAMRDNADLAELADRLQSFCDDEVEHRDDAAQRLERPAGLIARLWSRGVGVGSVLGVAIARRI